MSYFPADFATYGDEKLLRDMFAGQAMAAMLVNHKWNTIELAQNAYRAADAMLAERKAETPVLISDEQAAENKERAKWTPKQWYEHVGAWETPEGHISFGSPMAVSAMLKLFHKVHGGAK